MAYRNPVVPRGHLLRIGLYFEGYSRSVVKLRREGLRRTTHYSFDRSRDIGSRIQEPKRLTRLAHRCPCCIRFSNIVLAFARVSVSFSSSSGRKSTKMSITDFRDMFTAFKLRPRFLLRLLFAAFRAFFSPRYNLAIFAQYNRHGISASSLCFFEAPLTPL